MSMNQVFSILGELQANVRGANVSLPPVSLQEKEVTVEVPEFQYKSNVVEIPHMQVVDKAVESQWEILEQRRMSSEDVRSSTVLKMQRQIDRVEIEGEWCPIDSSLKVGDVICTTKPIMSSDEGLQISISVDSRNEIKLVDEDGDVQIFLSKVEKPLQ